MYYEDTPVQAVDGRVEAMRQFVEIEREIAEMEEAQRRTRDQLEKARTRRGELVAQIREFIDGPAENKMAPSVSVNY